MVHSFDVEISTSIRQNFASTITGVHEKDENKKMTQVIILTSQYFNLKEQMNEKIIQNFFKKSTIIISDSRFMPQANYQSADMGEISQGG